MAKITNQVSVTLDLEHYGILETIAEENDLRPGGAARVFVLQRLALYGAGWKLNNQRLEKILRIVSAMGDEDLYQLEGYLRKKGHFKRNS